MAIDNQTPQYSILNAVPWHKAPVIAKDFINIGPQLIALIATIVTRVPEVSLANPEPTADFHNWLAAMDSADGEFPGTYAKLYGEELTQNMRELIATRPTATTPSALAVNELSSAKLGNPPKRYYDLNSMLSADSQQTQDWPRNARSMEYRLKMFQLGLGAMGIVAKFCTLGDGSIYINVEPMNVPIGNHRLT